MKLSTEFFLAWRYLKPQRNAVSVITCISLAGVILGVAVLIVVLSVMTGFTQKMEETLLSTISHIQISSPYGNEIPNLEKAVATVKKSGADPLPIIRRECIIQSGDKVDYKYLIGIDQTANNSAFNLEKEIVGNESRFDLSHRKIIISSVIAEELGLKVGDKIILHSPSKLQEMIDQKKSGQLNISKSNKVYLPDEFTISALYSFDKRDFDENIIFVGRDDAAELYGFEWGAATHIYVWTKDAFNIKQIMYELQARLPELSIVSWKNLQRNVLDMLSLEKVIMVFLLAFIVMVASICILCTLITVVVQKRREIGVLKSIGATPRAIMHIFSLQGFIVGFTGTALGIAAGLIIVANRQTILKIASDAFGRNLWNPKFYFFEGLPAVVNPTEVLIIAATSIILCTLGAVIPASMAARIEPAKAMRS